MPSAAAYKMSNVFAGGKSIADYKIFSAHHVL